MSREERKAMVAPDRPGLSLSRQCRLLSVSRSSFYYAPKGESPENLALMRRIDELFLNLLWQPADGTPVVPGRCLRGRHRVRRLMRLMGLEAIYQAPKTSAPHPAHRIYPYLLRNVTVERADHVWCADITYIPVRRGFLYLIAIMDWATRHVLAWRLSNTMDAGFCVEASERGAGTNTAGPRSSTPTRAASSPASTSPACSRTRKSRSPWMGAGRCMDNIFIERLWRSLKYEAVYLHEMTDGFAAERVIGEWIAFYNIERPHSALDGRTPAEAYLSRAACGYDGQG